MIHISFPSIINYVVLLVYLGVCPRFIKRSPPPIELKLQFCMIQQQPFSAIRQVRRSQSARDINLSTNLPGSRPKIPEELHHIRTRQRLLQLACKIIAIFQWHVDLALDGQSTVLWEQSGYFRHAAFCHIIETVLNPTQPKPRGGIAPYGS